MSVCAFYEARIKNAGRLILCCPGKQ